MSQRDATGQAPASSAFLARLEGAQEGDDLAVGSLLQSFRPYLLAIARRELPDALRGKYDPADLVQETLLEAHRGLAGFAGSESDAFRVWLCGILRHNLIDLIRRYRDASKRSIGRERSLAAGPGTDDPVGGGVDPNPTPCTQSMAREDIQALREALLRLPAHERAVVVLRHFECLPYHEIGVRLGRSPEAARKLWERAISRLQRLLKDHRKPAW